MSEQLNNNSLHTAVTYSTSAHPRSKFRALSFMLAKFQFMMPAFLFVPGEEGDASGTLLCTSRRWG